MQPPAEHVHWMFATGFLLLGAVPARGGGRRSRGLAATALACVPVAVVRLPQGVLMWPS